MDVEGGAGAASATSSASSSSSSSGSAASTKASPPVTITKRGVEQALREKEEEFQKRLEANQSEMMRQFAKSMDEKMAERGEKHRQETANLISTQVSATVTGMKPDLETYVGKLNLKRGPGGTPPRGKEGGTYYDTSGKSSGGTTGVPPTLPGGGRGGGAG